MSSTTELDKMPKSYCFWCGMHGSLDTASCWNCGYEIGTYPPEIKDLIIKEKIEELKNLPVGSFDSTPYRNKRLEELQKELGDEGK